MSRLLLAVVVCASRSFALQSQQPGSSEAPFITLGNLGLWPMFASIDSPAPRVQTKVRLIQQLVREWAAKGGDLATVQSKMEQVGRRMSARQFAEAESGADEVLAMLGATDRPLPDAAQALHRAERATYLAAAKTYNLTGIEDYIGWAAVEPEPGKAMWEVYRQDAAAIHDAGFRFIPYLWIQTLPACVKNDPKMVFAGNIATGLETGALSIFAAETLAAYDRFYGEAAREIGASVDVLRIGSPYDYGETAYPAGAAKSAFPMKNLEPGFWVNEAPARAHFREWMRHKYTTIQDLNAAWGSSFAGFASLAYPKDDAPARYRLDFIRWYHEAFTERMGLIVDVARKHFPRTPIVINLGWPFEKVNLGQDITGLLKMAGGKHLDVRTPTGPAVPFLYTKRVATAARHYAPARFSSEPADGSASCQQVALAYFKDLTTGVKWHFDYPGNLDRCPQLLTDFRALWLGGEYPKVDAALFFPAAAHYLENGNQWKEEGYGGGFPEGLREYAEELRDRLDYDVVDERLVQDGFLDAYRVLIWPVGRVAERATLERVKAWVEHGGTLLIADLKSVRAVDGAAVFADWRWPSGKVIDIGREVKDLESTFPGELDARDGVLVSTFREGVLLFNGGGQMVVKTISTGRGRVQVRLAPLRFEFYAGAVR